MEVMLSSIPYEYRFAAASVLMSRGNKLIDKADTLTHERRVQFVVQVLEALAYFDMALLLVKRFDPNYQTLLNWKCQALISIGQFEDARKWYEELIHVANESDGPGHIGPTASLALTQLASIDGKPNAPLPLSYKVNQQLFDTPPFCTWAQNVCGFLVEGKLKQFQECIRMPLRESFKPERLKRLLGDVTAQSKLELKMQLEKYEWRSNEDSASFVGWCYFSLTGQVYQPFTLGIARTATNGFEIHSLQFEHDGA